MKQRGFRYCPACGTKLQKRGLTRAGTQRWYCAHCVSSATKPRPDLVRAFALERFVAWLMGKQSQVELSHNLTDRMWRIQTAWCWQVVPKPTLTGEIYPVILLDGIRIGSLVCLIARTPEHVIGWTWAGWESSITWEKLLERLPPTSVAVCDGQKGILLAIARCWPSTRVQRCHFHVWQNIRVKLTLHPQTIAGQELLQLARNLLKGIATKEAAEEWQKQLKSWEQRHGNFIRERTYNPDPKPGQRTWRYTHERANTKNN